MKVTDFIGEEATSDCGRIWGVDKTGGLQMVAEIRGWGAIQNLFKLKGGGIDVEKAEAFQDELGKWIVDAINEKLEREKNR